MSKFEMIILSFTVGMLFTTGFFLIDNEKVGIDFYRLPKDKWSCTEHRPVIKRMDKQSGLIIPQEPTEQECIRYELNR